MKDSSDAMSLTFDEFCHIRNVITRSELETLLFDEKLYNEVAQSKVRHRRPPSRALHLHSSSYASRAERCISIISHSRSAFNAAFASRKSAGTV